LIELFFRNYEAFLMDWRSLGLCHNLTIPITYTVKLL
jgi:hypothetical protein